MGLEKLTENLKDFGRKFLIGSVLAGSLYLGACTTTPLLPREVGAQTYQEETLENPIGIAFAANYVQDFNNNGIIDQGEVVGGKDRFFDYKQIILVLASLKPASDVPEREVRYEVYGPKGNKCLGGSITTGANWIIAGGKGTLMNSFLKTGGYGNYTIAWHSEGQVVTKNFEIVPSKEK